MSRTIKEIRDLDPGLRRDLLNAISSAHFISEVLESREAAVAFIAEMNGPIKAIQKKFNMPCGKTIKVK